MINYLGLITSDNYKERVHDISNTKNFLCITAILKDGVPDSDIAEVQYTVIPKAERMDLPFEPWVSSPLGFKSNQLIQYNIPRTPVAAVRLHPLSGSWDCVVREITSDEITLNEATYS